MKYLILLGDGMADDPVDSLQGRTPLQTAHTPHMDRIARQGRCGLLETVPNDMTPGSETANLSVMGYDPRRYLEGRGVLEAASMGIDVAPDQIAMRCNLICLDAHNRIKNHSAGHISSPEAAELIAMLNREIMPEGLQLYPGVSYRHLFVGRGLSPRLDCAPPHDHPDERAEQHMIHPLEPEARPTADLLNNLTRRSWAVLADHPVNRRRIEQGKDPANSIWLWSPGRRPTMPTFAERFGISGAVISAVDLIRGLGVYAGLEIIRVPGATGLYDTNYEGKADAAFEALERLDFCYVHVEAPDEAGHEGDAALKVRTIEDLDARLLGRLMHRLDQRGLEIAVAVLPDHYTPVARRIHVGHPVPFALRSPNHPADAVERFSEADCATGGFGRLAGDAFIRALLADADN